MTTKLAAAKSFPSITVTHENGTTVDLSDRAQGLDWKMVIVYRGRHCPLCTRFLNNFEAYVDRLKDIGIDVIAVSGDSKEQMEDQKAKLEISFPLAYGLTTDQMKQLGLYISDPRSPEETDHPFAEPGLFVINADGNVHMTNISNAPFLRPDLETLVGGLEFVRSKDYPIRGTHAY